MRLRFEGLYAITDEHLTPPSTIVAQVEEAIRAGVTIVQYRHKHQSDEEALAVCRSLRSLCFDLGALFVVDDRPLVAAKVMADGLHIGQDDISIEEARELFPKGVIGVSCYGDLNRAKEAMAKGAGYVAFGSFFPSPTKPNSALVPLSLLGEAKQQLSLPVCAIGGIDASTIAQVAAYAPDMIACVSAIFGGTSIEANVKTLITRIYQ
ncbi:MAG: thiamine phosphate synthase [Campylobacterales bacterium]